MHHGDTPRYERDRLANLGEQMNRRYDGTAGSNDGHLRVIALICAIVVVGGAWMAMEWLAQADRLDGVPRPPSVAAPASPQHRIALPPVGARTMPAPVPNARSNTIYKCTVGESTVYADVPCGDRVETIVLAAPSAGLVPERSYADQLARVRTERARHAALRPVPVASASRGPSIDDSCAAIDEAVRQIDTITHQPLSIPQAEYYRARRKALMDERFSLGCNG